MEYPVLISPTLSLQAAELVEAWNSSKELSEKAYAKLVQPNQAQGYTLDPETMQTGMMLLGGFASGLALDFIKDRIKDFMLSYLQNKLAKRPPEAPLVIMADPETIEVDVKEMPPRSGKYIIIVKAKGE